MTFNWADYLKFAKIIKQIAEIDDEEMPFYSIQEAAHRSAISRAYYSVFSICLKYIQDNHPKEVLSQERIHSDVIGFFKRSSDKNKIKIGNILRDMRDNRNNVDYDDEVDDSLQNLSTDTLEQAHKILEIIKIL